LQPEENDNGTYAHPGADPDPLAYSYPDAHQHAGQRARAAPVIDALLILAVLCGCAGAWFGNRTSMALLASAGLSSALIWLGVPFVMPMWVLMDLAVVAVIASRPLKYSDCPVMALFVAAWALYPSVAAGEVKAAWLVDLIVAAQLLLSAPWRWVLHRLRVRPANLEAEGKFLKVSHAP
jgi:hypothetical protein